MGKATVAKDFLTHIFFPCINTVCLPQSYPELLSNVPFLMIMALFMEISIQPNRRNNSWILIKKNSLQ
jgi:branched-subunit amino acid transport protein